MFTDRKKAVSTKLTEKAFRKTAEKLIPMLREQNVPELDQYADKLEEQLKGADVPSVIATLAEVTGKLAQIKAAKV